MADLNGNHDPAVGSEPATSQVSPKAERASGKPDKPTSGKAGVRNEKPDNTKPAGPMIYVGPNLPGGKLSAYTVFRGGIPAHVSALADKMPDIHLLIVPIEQFAEAQQKARTQGTLEYRAAQNLTKGMVK